MSFPNSTVASLLRLARLLLVCAAVFGLAWSSALPALAAGGQNGNLSGTVIDANTKAPIADATVSAAAPTGSYSAKTDAHGFFTMIGLVVDTYTVSVQAPGYDPLSTPGVTIQGDSTVSVGTITLSKQLRTIGRVVARSASSVFQPKQTVDSYQVSGERILQTTGKAAATNENNLLLAVPGVTLSSAGNPTIRGGLRTEVGYQFDGVDFTEPFFAMNGSTGRFNGIGSVQVVEGAGDATQGNIGGGVVNLIPKRGTVPPFGFVDGEVGGPNFFHQFAMEYGFASKNGRISDYISYTGQRYVPYNGYSNANAAAYNNFYGAAYAANDDFLNNFVYKFGKDNNQSLQILYLNRNIQEWGNLGGITGGPNGTFYYPNDPTNYAATLFDGPNLYNVPVSTYQKIIGLNPGTPAFGRPNQGELVTYNPTRYLKFEYDNNLNATTFLQAKMYNWENLQGGSNNTGFSGANGSNLGLGAYPTWNETGGPKVGGRLDLTHQFSSKHTVTLDGLYEGARPIWNGYDPNALFFLMADNGVSGRFGNQALSYANFLAPNQCAGLPGCGYLAQYFPKGIPRMPVSGINYNQALFQNFGYGIREQWAPNDRLKADLGVRFDGQNQKYGFNPFNPTEPGNPSDVSPASIGPKFTQPRETEPRVALSYQMDPNDSLRAGYGRSTVFLTGQTAGTPAGMYNAAPFAKVPALPGFTCGSGGHNPGVTVPCQNYAQQLYWLYDQNFDAPDLGGALPALYNNYDITYQHQFTNGWGMRVTPFYKLGTNLPSFALVTGLAAGAAVFEVNNQGINRTTGVEFGVNTPDHPTGLSGFLSMTYQNVLGSTPPLIGGEDALPINGSGSLGLGDVYRAGYVSPFTTRLGAEFKTRNGWRLSPVLQYDRGYPFNVGDTIASGCGVLPNGGFANIPQSNIANGCGVTAIAGYQAQSGTSVATRYFDPANPGTGINPNIAWTRGTPSTPSSGGALWKSNLQAQMTIEYKVQRNTFGVLFNNLFGNAYNGTIPGINPYYQPVANGLSGPQTGINPLYNPSRGFVNIPKDAYAFTNGAYLLLPNEPMSFQVYFQRSL
jgi:hypothetical protein